jgi:DNA polymerase III alpha subunit
MYALEDYFKIKPIDTDEYNSRLSEEIKLLEELNYVWFIERTVEIYNNHINKYPNLLRGSAGSSLLLYYLGLNQIDPVKYSIPLTRFINKLRANAPDIDIDVPLSVRDNLIEEIIKNNSDTIRMTSDNNNETNIYLESLINEDPSSSIVHNSGIVIYSQEQKTIIEDNKLTPTRIKLTKNNIGNYNLKKIDLLANTAMEQLYFIDNQSKISNYNFEDDILYKFIIEDDGIGITYAETPMVQNVIKILKPSNIEQLSICLAIVRPFACDTICENMNWTSLKNEMIYDDDFIIYLKDKMGYDEENADKIRRIFKTNTDTNKMNTFIQTVDLSDMILGDKIKLKKTLRKLSKYSFCKAHSINHARMIYCLYWNKYYNAKKFWISTVKNIKGYYKDWVYIRKGLENGLKFKGIEKCNSFYHWIHTGYWLNKDFMTRTYFKNNSENNLTNVPKIDLVNNDNNDNNVSNIKDIKDNKHNSLECDNLLECNNLLECDNSLECDDLLESNKISVNNDIDQPKIKYNQECEFRGLIAGIGNITTKYKKYQLVITLGYDNNKFINLHLNKKKDLSKFKQIIGKGYRIDSSLPYIVITQMTLL